MRKAHLCRQAVYGISGMDGEDTCWWWHKAMGYAPARTLEHYLGYPGFGLSKAILDKYGKYQDVYAMASKMKRRPLNKDRYVGKDSGTRAHFPLSQFRWQTGFGIEISADILGKYKPTGYGGITTIVIFVDPGHRFPFARIFLKRPKRPGEEESALVAMTIQQLVKDYALAGHHSNEWGVPIGTIRSDPGKEFVSEETRAMCTDLHIDQLWSTPYCHEQNGTVESYVMRLFILVTAWYAAAKWIPRHLWPYAIAYSVHVLNLQAGPEGTVAWEEFYGRKYNFRAKPLMPFGQPLLVFVPKEIRTWKFGDRGIPAMYVGIPEGIKEGIYVYIPLTGKVRIAREYHIVDGIPREWPRYPGNQWMAADSTVDPTEESTLGNPTEDLSFDNVFVEDDLLACLEESGELESADVDDVLLHQQVDAPVQTLSEVVPLEEVEGGSSVDAAPNMVDVVVDGHSTPDGRTAVVPTMYIPMEVEEGFLASLDSEATATSSSEEERAEESGDSEGGPSVAPAITSTDSGSDPRSEAFTPIQPRAVVPPPLRHDGAVSVTAMGASDVNSAVSAQSTVFPSPTPTPASLMPSDGAGDILPPRPEGNKLVFERIKVSPLLSDTPNLAYTIVIAGAEPARKMSGGRRLVHKVCKFQLALSRKMIADAHREKVRLKKVHFQDELAAKHYFPAGRDPNRAVSGYDALRGPHRTQVLDAMKAEINSRAAGDGSLLEKGDDGNALLAAVRKVKKKRSPDNPSLQTALSGPHEQQVRDALDKEVSSYLDTFNALELLSEEERSKMSREDLKKALTSHFEIEFKRDAFTGELVRVKARLVIHGNQVEKYHFDDIKSPTARPAAVRLLLSMLAKTTPQGTRFTGRSWDVPSAFLQNGILDRWRSRAQREPEVEEPPAILLRLPDGRIGRLKSYVYGLKQASYEWYMRIREVLVANDFVATEDPCVFKLWQGADCMFVCIHVDDVFAIATEEALHDKLDGTLDSQFADGETKILSRHVGSELAYLKMRIRCTVDEYTGSNAVEVDQTLYIEKVIKEWGYGQSTSAAGIRLFSEDEPGITDHPMQASYSPKEDDDVAVDSTWYRGVVGAINYAAGMTRPELLYAMSVLAENCNAPTRLHKRMVKRVLKYLKGTAERCLVFKGDDDWRLAAWADASYASREGAKSQSGYCFALGADNAVFYAKSKKQNLVTLSSTEAEYVALHHTVTEVVYLRRLLSTLGFPQLHPTVVFQDNQSTILWARGQRNHARTKHLDVKFHYVADLIQDEIIELDYLNTSDMVADILTKPLLFESFSSLASKMTGYYI